MQCITPKNRKHTASLPHIAAFLKEHWDGSSPLLLGYSGGPDSKALLYALLEEGVKNLHLAHVDHGWREESGAEAEALRGEAERLGCPFHTVRLAKPGTGNWEDEARKGRLAFFQSLFMIEPFQALLLAHQKEDQAETVLKRVLEGSHSLHGIEPAGRFEGMAVWRPLLNVRKREILSFLGERGLAALSDRTNEDPAYLRARMRREILPFLANSFGKDPVENLALLGERSLEWKRYLEKKVSGVKMERGPWGVYVEMDGWERVEKRQIVLRLAKEEGIVFPRGELEDLLDWLDQGSADRKMEIQGRKFCADRKILFLLAAKLPVFEAPMEIGVGRKRSGDWIVEGKEAEGETFRPPCWKDVWSGRFTLLLEKGNFLLDWAALNGALGKLWSDRKTPSFFRRLVPIVLRDGALEGEFLSGRAVPGKEPKVRFSFYFAPKDSVSEL